MSLGSSGGARVTSRPARRRSVALFSAICGLVAVVPLAQAQRPNQVPAWDALTPVEQRAALAAVEGAPLRDRLVSLSAHFLGARYVVSPLGEGEGFDPDPLFRSDAADCLTFVEQSLALAKSKTPDEVLSHLNRLRYSEAGVGYASRLHLMEAQWIPTQVARGLLRDITREVGGEATVRTDKTLTAKSWASGSSRALALPAERQVQGRFAFDVLPLAEVESRMSSIPEGALLMVVREERELKATRMTHLGIVLHRSGRVWLRHAARNGYGRVVDEDLKTFLTRNGRYGRWPVVGVSLYAPIEPQAPAVVASPVP